MCTDARRSFISPGTKSSAASAADERLQLIVRVICGPTAGGKSAIAMKLAGKRSLAIISADSRQIYRGFDVGTAKPGASERQHVLHYGIDISSPEERYSAARFADDAREWIADAVARGLTPVVVGGTGLYIKSLFEPLSPVTDLDPHRRSELHEFLREQPIAELRRWCESLDPVRAHLGKTQLIRAIETALLSGEKLSDSHRRHADAVNAKGGADLTPSYLLVDPIEKLHSRIESRVDEMLARGWIDEARALDSSVPSDAPAWNASGYEMIRDVARGVEQLATARARIIIETRQYAKRQRTWFRNQLPADRVTKIDPESPGEDLLVEQWWDAAGVK
jgi:tRNA dimethylallyltransferase